MSAKSALASLVATLLAGTCVWTSAAEPAAPPAIIIQNECLELGLTAQGQTVRFSDRRTGTDYAAGQLKAPLARLTKAGREYPVSAASYADGLLTAQFGGAGVTAILQITVHPRYLIWAVKELRGEDVQEFTFLDIPLTTKGTADEPFAACALALNLQTRVHELPGPNSRLRALCYPRFGFAGAQVAVLGCPQSELRATLKEVVSHAPELPQTRVGGPWALDAPAAFGSYMFNFSDLSEDKVDNWIRLAQSLGITQIDFHGGTSFRFGDCLPNPQIYPRGRDSLKAVIDKLHAAGIQAGLHTYAFFMAKNCPWVTPVPDPRLGKDATFTLAEALPAAAVSVPVQESTATVSNVTGFFVRNSVTLQIDDELITYQGASKAAPFTFTGCTRGAYGTRMAPHAKGAKVHHLRECFGLFLPDGDSTLFAEVAAKTAETYNACGFDMIYLDALDGEDSVAGAAYGWHYGAKFAYELCRRLQKPAILEMSTFHHHLWCVRSRLGAWDHPNRSHKKFIDIHCDANTSCRRMFLPAHLGWWSFKTWSGAKTEPTFTDDIEYLCGKALAHDCGLSIMGITPETAPQTPALPRLAAIVKRYEELRRANYFSDEVKAQLRVPGAEFTLVQTPDGKWQLRPIRYEPHKVQGLSGGSERWKVTNSFGRQPLQLRLEALLSAGPYDAAGNITLADFADAKDFPHSAAQPGVTPQLETTREQLHVDPVSGRYRASNTLDARRGAWSEMAKTFEPPTNLTGHEALGLWVHGDGKGELLNLQLRSPTHLSNGIEDYYIPIDFTGWSYFELVEPEGRRHAEYTWPYGDIYSIYREHTVPGSVQRLALYYNNLPPKDTATCYLSPIRALPTVKVKLRNPTITVGGKQLVFPVEMESGSYLELRAPASCTLYGPAGEVLREVPLQGEIPMLEAGENQLQFSCEPPPGLKPRVQLTVISQ